MSETDENVSDDSVNCEASRRSQRWLPTMSDGNAVPVGAILTGDELTLAFDRPEFDSDVTVGYTEPRASGIADGPEDETLIQRLEHWARDRDYDFTRTTRPEYVEGFRDAQGVVLGLIQAWEEPRGETTGVIPNGFTPDTDYVRSRYPHDPREFDRWLAVHDAVENEECIQAREADIAHLVLENARQLAIIEQVRIYAVDRAHYGRGGREVASARIATDLQEILNPRRRG